MDQPRPEPTKNRGRYCHAARLTNRQRAIDTTLEELQLDGHSLRSSTDEAA